MHLMLSKRDQCSQRLLGSYRVQSSDTMDFSDVNRIWKGTLTSETLQLKTDSILHVFLDTYDKGQDQNPYLRTLEISHLEPFSAPIHTHKTLIILSASVCFP